MRTKRRVTKFIVAAIAVATLGGIAPANAGCAYVTLYVERNGVPTYVANDKCVDTPWVTDASNVQRRIGSDSAGLWVGAELQPATPP